MTDSITAICLFMSASFLILFNFTRDIVPNHMISIDTKDMPEFFQTPEFEGRSMKTQKLEMLPVECVVRGYITGSGWESYKKEGKICGIELPEGLQECQKLPEPLFTPSTKAPVGEHDMNISMEEGIVWVEKFFPGKGKEYMEKMRDLTLALYKKCADYALERGIIIADTKFEFGLDEKGNVVLADEMLTPDNSRFWPLKGYEAGKSQPSYDKQFVRDYLKANNAEILPQDLRTAHRQEVRVRTLRCYPSLPRTASPTHRQASLPFVSTRFDGANPSGTTPSLNMY